MHLNTHVTLDNQRYEIYWTTEAAQHVLDNYVKDRDGGVHKGLSHSLVSQLLRKALYILPLSEDKRPYVHVCLTKAQGKVYESYAYFVPELDHRPRRCVVITCYVSNKQHYRSLFDE